MYSLKNVLLQKPDAIKGVVLIILAALVAGGQINLDGEAVAMWGLGIERLLSLFYVQPLSVNKAGLADLVADPEVKPLDG